jgi:exopolyphosphatase/guanosine-5'-triphosphate,3'-diphosphate pyrophosphatase
MIKSSDLIGISNQEIELIALLVRHHSADFFSLNHEEIFLSAQEQLNFVKLAVLLSMANALDTGHKSKVKKITTEVRKRHIKVILESDQDLTLEAWSFQKIAKSFQKIFGIELRLSVVS